MDKLPGMMLPTFCTFALKLDCYGVHTNPLHILPLFSLFKVQTFPTQVFLAAGKTIGQLVEEGVNNFGSDYHCHLHLLQLHDQKKAPCNQKKAQHLSWGRVETLEGFREGFLAAKGSGQMLLRYSFTFILNSSIHQMLLRYSVTFILDDGF